MPESHVPIEELDLFRRFVEIADWARVLVLKWPPLARNTIGVQLVRAIDRVGATLVEGDGRYSPAEALHFFMIARGSARETRNWLERAMARNLLAREEGHTRLRALSSATQQLNSLIRYRRANPQGNLVRESSSVYHLGTEGFPYEE